MHLPQEGFDLRSEFVSDEALSIQSRTEVFGSTSMDPSTPQSLATENSCTNTPRYRTEIVELPDIEFQLLGPKTGDK